MPTSIFSVASACRSPSFRSLLVVHRTLRTLLRHAGTRHVAPPLGGVVVAVVTDDASASLVLAAALVLLLQELHADHLFSGCSSCGERLSEVAVLGGEGLDLHSHSPPSRCLVEHERRSASAPKSARKHLKLCLGNIASSQAMTESVSWGVWSWSELTSRRNASQGTRANQLRAESPTT
jgi:hypothetical protein